MTLDELIEGCKNNNQKCYTMLYNTYRPRLFMIIRRYINDIDTVEEILQLVFIKIYEKINSYNTTGSFESWLVMITKNKSIDYVRKINNNIEIIDNLPIGVNPEEEKQINEDNIINSNLIKEYLNELTPAYREVFELYVIQDYQHKEIAEMLGIKEGTSKSNLFKAKNKIKSLLKNNIICM